MARWIAHVKKHPATIVLGAIVGVIGILVARITDVQKVSALYSEWRIYSNLERPYPNRLRTEDVSRWGSGQTQLAILQIQGYLGEFKDGPRSVQLCLSDPTAFPKAAARQFNRWKPLQASAVDLDNLKMLNEQLERLDDNRLEDQRFLPITNVYARLLARGEVQLFYGNAFRSWSSEFDAIPKDSLFFLRNGLYARHGRPFSGARTRRFFNRRAWYTVDPHFTEANLNAVEICNAYFLKERFPNQPTGSWGRGIRLAVEPQPPLRDIGDALCSQLDAPGVGMECYVRNDLSSQALQTDFTDFEVLVGVADETSVTVTVADAVETAGDASPVSRQIRVSARAVASAIATAGLGPVGETRYLRRGYSSLRVSLGPHAIAALRQRPAALTQLVPSIVTAVKDVFVSLDASLDDPLASTPRKASPHASEPAPTIVAKMLPFDKDRRDLTLDYLRRHYGVELESPYIVPRMIVLHWTGVDTLQESYRELEQSRLPAQNADLLRGGDLNVSAHFLIDRDGTIYQLLPETAVARHAIGLNLDAVGIENVGGTSTAPLTDKQRASNAALIRALVGRHPIEWLVGHFETSRFRGTPLWRETDPSYLTSKRDPSEEFMTKVRTMVADLNLKEPPHAATP